MQVNEHGKERTALIVDGYEYSETVRNESDKIVEYFNMCAYSDYSFMYVNLTGEAKVGNFLVEIDSAFYDAFKMLLDDLSELKITDDFSERFICFKKNEDDDIVVSIHLLEDEVDGTITVKNIMYDLRSRADQDDSDIKDRLRKFFGVLSFIIQNSNIEEKKLAAKK